MEELLKWAWWRQAGPFRGGRVVAVAGDPTRAGTFYFGGAAGGVFKSDDAGATWVNVSDGFFTAASVGALAVAASDPAVVYAGMGEACIRGNVVAGDGVWRSLDGGATWEHRGLLDSQHIARVRVHPHDPDLVYVAVFGHVYGPSTERGVYRSRDGGRHWEQVLYRDDHTGAIDLVMDPTRPSVLYAALWDAHRRPWALCSGGPGSGIFRSFDGGDSWEELTDRPGLPGGLKGRIGVAVAGGTGRVWAIVEAERGGLYRSDDAGERWQLVSDNPDLKQRPFYYMHLFAHPQDPDTVYCLNLGMWRSRDAGRTFSAIPTPHGDNHDLWIDPHHPDRMIEGNDGGAVVTYNGGRTWTLPYNQPTGQFYHVTTDQAFPYRIYGAQQDNSTLSLPSFSDRGFITAGDTYPVGGGESGYIAVRPDAPHIVYAGNYASRMTRYDHRSHREVDITAWPEDPIGYGAGELRYRFQWTFPLVLSPHDPNRLYTAGNVVFCSTCGGDRWEPISPDLTRAAPHTMLSSGGPITKDNVSTEIYATVFALAESPRAAGVLWAGSDDGLVHVTRDGGQHWTDVTPPGLPEWALISIIEPSPHEASRAYVAATRYKSDDRRPYLYRTRDYGATWEDVTGDLPATDFTRVIREDPERPGLLYAGTESGVYLSWDDGGHWHRLSGTLPVVPVHDLAVHGTDLIAATHGRGFWILDDITPYRQGDPGTHVEDLHLFSPRPAYRLRTGRRFQREQPPDFHQYRQAGGEMVVGAMRDGRFEPQNAGVNPEPGAVFTLLLGDGAAGPLTVRIKDKSGAVIRQASSTDTDGWGTAFRVVPGLQRLVWDLRVESGVKLPDGTLSAYWGGSTVGPRVPPGLYTVEVDIAGAHAEQTFEVRADPRLDTSPEDFEAQYRLLLQIRDRLSEIHTGILASRRLRAQMETWAGRLDAGHGDAAAAVRELAAALLEAEGELNESRSRGHADSFNFPPKVNSKIASLESTVSFGDARPPQQCYDVFAVLSEQAEAGLTRLRERMAEATQSVNDLVAEAGLKALPES